MVVAISATAGVCSFNEVDDTDFFAPGLGIGECVALSCTASMCASPCTMEMKGDSTCFTSIASARRCVSTSLNSFVRSASCAATLSCILCSTSRKVTSSSARNFASASRRAAAFFNLTPCAVDKSSKRVSCFTSFASNAARSAVCAARVSFKEPALLSTNSACSASSTLSCLLTASSCASNVANAAAPLCAVPSTSACRASALLSFEECAAATAAPLAASLSSFASSAATCAFRAL